MKIFITALSIQEAAAAAPSPAQGAARAAGIRNMAMLTSGVHSRLASSEKKANVPKCRYIIGAVVIWQAVVMAQTSTILPMAFLRVGTMALMCG